MRARARSTARAWARGIAGVLAGVLIFAVTALWVLDRWDGLQLRSQALTVAASFIGLVPPLLGVAFLLLIVALPGWWRLIGGALVLVLMASVVVTAAGRPDREAVQPNLVVLAQNTYYGWADPAALTRRATDAHADIVVLPEITTRTLAGLRGAGWDALYPYRAGTPVGDWNDAGLMVFARYPLTVTGSGPRPGVALRLEVARPGAALTFVAVHFANPVNDWAAWTDDFAWLRNTLARQAGAPVVVAGDFNAVPQHDEFRTLLATARLGDAAAEAGDLWSPTFPSPRSYPPPARWAIPVMQLDHVLVGAGVKAAQLSTFRIDGTDHRGLVARLRVG